NSWWVLFWPSPPSQNRGNEWLLWVKMRKTRSEHNESGSLPHCGHTSGHRFLTFSARSRLTHRNKRRRYSITSSALSRTDVGRSRPERPGHFEIDNELDLGRLLDRRFLSSRPAPAREGHPRSGTPNVGATRSRLLNCI